MAIGALLVAALVVWALTRTVEPAATGEMPPIAADSPTTQTPIGSTTSQVNMTEPANFGDQSDVKRIAAEDLKLKFDRGEVTIIDVRDANSYASSHIPGSLNIPFASVQGMLDLIPKGKEIVTYCT